MRRKLHKVVLGSANLEISERREQLAELHQLLEIKLAWIGTQAGNKAMDRKDLLPRQRFELWQSVTTTQSRKKYSVREELKPVSLPDLWDWVGSYMQVGRGTVCTLDMLVEFLELWLENDEKRIGPYLEVLMEKNVESITFDW